MNIVVMGSTGIIGSQIFSCLSCFSQLRLIPLSSSNLDIYRSLEQLEKMILALEPNIVINAVGFTNIDEIEENKNKGFFLNCLFPHCLAEICYRSSIQLVHFSSDNVFNGLKNEPYTEEDKLSPINYYGWTKAHTDEFLVNSFFDTAIIFRISGIYSYTRKNFFTSFLQRLAKQDTLDVVSDIFVAPTPATLVAKSIAELIHNKQIFTMRGVYNLTPRGKTSWFGFAKIIVDTIKPQNKSIFPVTSEIFSSKVKRPKMCILNSQKLENKTSISLPNWEEALEEFINLDNVKFLVNQFI
ncbi:MAG: SDR family oxidoreductase [Cylindrospermopsis raciborskii KL1]|uniref:SDR family oxidoreductase n=1 Tax=Cylindrospermopsis raciborskii TaxID=77022 RepID=UPI001A2A276E|nr:SDR family oxidoreductase [Cylindrospermopsis raciborskii]MBG0744393.1 SDR family oxidoreductase [Cylindrospermopsis raciborskii KL1]